jgi:hypothetical protein
MTITSIRPMRAEDAQQVQGNQWRDVVFVERRSPHVN